MLGFHPNETGSQERVRQIAILLLVMLGDEASVPAAGFSDLSLNDHLVDDACHVFSGGRILGARQISNRKHRSLQSA
jgi:hypothetical protein